MGGIEVEAKRSGKAFNSIPLFLSFPPSAPKWQSDIDEENKDNRGGERALSHVFSLLFSKRESKRNHGGEKRGEKRRGGGEGGGGESVLFLPPLPPPKKKEGLCRAATIPIPPLSFLSLFSPLFSLGASVKITLPLVHAVVLQRKSPLPSPFPLP